ncbi:hypothetical protein EGW08_008394 [Elysia chlorotica]|uniref:Alpha-N-acetylglucosaminidase N-terminal domain-containing protein n=1 Tax=Elysia chlorotica TaxID=188477 RepID=A0A433TQG2_ELYCH|nr:hypothetical protein EGW08_008394 [Elysia chlorotica]
MKLLGLIPYITLLSVAVCIDFPQLQILKSWVKSDVQGKAAADLIRRQIGDRVSDFVIEIDQGIGPQDTFELSSLEDGRVRIVANGGVAVAMGFYHYLKYFCNGQRTWAGKQTELPAVLPVLKTAVKVSTPDRSVFICKMYIMMYQSYFIST